jgi:hypothetical protein
MLSFFTASIASSCKGFIFKAVEFIDDYEFRQTIAGYASFYLHKYLNFQMVSVDSEVKEQDAELLLTSVLYLACKVSEQFRTIRDVFNVVKAIMNPGIVVSDLDKVSPEFVHLDLSASLSLS